jgi:hypothetical protein
VTDIAPTRIRSKAQRFQRLPLSLDEDLGTGTDTEHIENPVGIEYIHQLDIGETAIRRHAEPAQTDVPSNPR